MIKLCYSRSWSNVILFVCSLLILVHSHQAFLLLSILMDTADRYSNANNINDKTGMNEMNIDRVETDREKNSFFLHTNEKTNYMLGFVTHKI